MKSIPPLFNQERLIILIHLQIGHTHLTVQSVVALTVAHILGECSHYNDNYVILHLFHLYSMLCDILEDDHFNMINVMYFKVEWGLPRKLDGHGFM